MCMIRRSLLAAAATVVLASSGASAMPMASFKSLETQDQLAQQVRLVCTPSGRCYRTGPRYRTVRRYGPSYYGGSYYAPSYGYGSGYGYGGYGYGGYGYRRPGVTFGLGW